MTQKVDYRADHRAIFLRKGMSKKEEGETNRKLCERSNVGKTIVNVGGILKKWQNHRVHNGNIRNQQVFMDLHSILTLFSNAFLNGVKESNEG